MRAALWLMTLFALAAAGAWLAGNNQGTVTLFLFPHRIDLSLNLAVLAVFSVVLLVILAQRALAAFLALPHGVAAEIAVPLLEAGLTVIDLSADFRIEDPAVYREFYDHEHPENA